MATVIKVKRSSISGKKPSTSDLDFGELALNVADKRLYTKNNTTVLEIGSNPSTLSVNSAYSFPISDGQAGQVLKTDGNGNLSFSSSHTVTVNSGNTASAGIVENFGDLDTSDAIVANPLGHLVFNINGVDYKIPYMAAVANTSPGVSSGDITANTTNISAVSNTFSSLGVNDPIVANPDGHLVVHISGVDYKLPFFI